MGQTDQIRQVKGNRHMPNNQRPISLTSAMAKILESINMYQNNFINPSQHGFTSRKSCITQLLTAMDIRHNH